MQQKAIEVQAPNPVTIDQDYLNIFLAGSIEIIFEFLAIS